MPSKRPKTARVKVGTLLDPGIYQKLKARALAEQRPVHQVMETAIERYTDAPPPDLEKRMAAAREFCKNHFPNVSAKDLKKIMELDPYGAD